MPPEAGRLPDPASGGIGAHLRAEPGGVDQPLRDRTVWSPDWPDYRPKQVELVEQADAAEPITLAWVGDSLRIALGKAEQATVELSSTIREDFADRLAVVSVFLTGAGPTPPNRVRVTLERRDPPAAGASDPGDFISLDGQVPAGVPVWRSVPGHAVTSGSNGVMPPLPLPSASETGTGSLRLRVIESELLSDPTSDPTIPELAQRSVFVDLVEIPAAWATVAGRTPGPASLSTGGSVAEPRGDGVGEAVGDELGPPGIPHDDLTRGSR
jgi:hypothetical protein